MRLFGREIAAKTASLASARRRAYVPPMTDERLDGAMERLDRALARAEHAATAREVRAGTARALARLEERHATLRARVRETIGRLDALIDDGKAAG